MSKVVVTEAYLNDIAEEIRAKNGSSATYTPGQMAAAIEAIPTGGDTPTGTISISQNGTYNVTQYASADVDVEPTLQSKTVSQNGMVTPDSGYDGLSSVLVNVSGGGVTPVKIMEQGQVSSTSAYMTAGFDSGVDITTYDALRFDLWKNGVKMGTEYAGTTFLASYYDFAIDGDLTYKMRLTSTAISCYQYTGAYYNLYVDVYGINF